jgi:S-adenosylmethionine:tRNA ribosyltransferase-isomerase
MKLDELEYELPRELIATAPPEERDGARLMLVDRAVDSPSCVTPGAVRSLDAYVPTGALMVVNDTRVINARLRGRKPTGGVIEVFLLRALDADARRWSAFCKASKPVRAGLEVLVSDALTVRVLGRDPQGTFEVELCTDEPWAAIERDGEVPLPPYMDRAPTEEDRARYQCVYAARPGAVAAPTAGLHLSERVLEALDRRGVERCAVTLHVGAGTFQPVTVDDLDAHAMHREWYEVPAGTAERVLAARREGRPVFAIGTTVVRALESWSLDAGPRTGETSLLIQPGFSFRAVDMLLTNFHLPRSTLLSLVMAFAGIDRTRAAYAEAVRERYRFFSYGDAMLIR